MDIGERIAQLRGDNISASQLSEAAGLARGHVALIERGVAKNPSLSTLRRIADALGVDVRELLNPDDNPSPPPANPGE